MTGGIKDSAGKLLSADTTSAAVVTIDGSEKMNGLSTITFILAFVLVALLIETNNCKSFSASTKFKLAVVP